MSEADAWLAAYRIARAEWHRHIRGRDLGEEWECGAVGAALNIALALRANAYPTTTPAATAR
jgi:hypothetical protein